LLCCFYEFRYLPVATELQTAIDRGVEVKLIIDAKVNESTDADGKFHESFPRVENLKTIADAGIDMAHVILREARTANIQHNKFMVLLKGVQKKPAEVWTGSTNISNGGFHGQTNVGHWVRDEETAKQFRAYWEVMSLDPGARDADASTDVRRKNTELRKT
ncbi:MAG: phospholipase D-like domain-containing protein, partial [Planctomyces sp.]